LELFLALISVVIAVGLAILLPIASWARTFRLEREIRELRARLAGLEARERDRGAHDAVRDAARGVTPAAPPATAPSASPPTVAPPVAPPVVPVASAPPTVATPAATVGAALSPTPVVGAPAVSAPAATSGIPPAPPVPPSAAATTLPPVPPNPEGLEEAIGGRLMLWVGAVVLLLGLAFFLKYAFDNDWITESMRVMMGIATGLALAIAGDRFASRGYRAYGQVISGGGIAGLFLSVYAAFSYYGLIGQVPAFTLLVLVTGGAALLADRQQALSLAVMAVGGGFVTPFLVGSGTDAQLTLFTYDALLVCGTLFLANRHDWPVLNALSFIFTWITILAWAAEFYRPEKWLRTELFLTLFCVLFVAILRAQVRQRGWRSLASLLLAVGPIVYHLSSIAILSSHGVPMWVYLIAITVVSVGMAVRLESTGLRMASWVLVMVPLAVWIADHQNSNWFVANLVSAGAIFVLHALAQFDVVFRHERRLGAVDNILQHLNGYALILLVYLALENVALASAPGATLAIGAVHGGIAWLLRTADRRAALHALAVAIGALTIALALRLDGPWLTIALAIEGLAVITLGLHFLDQWYRLAGFGFIAIAIIRYLVLSLPTTPTVFALFQDQAFAVGAFLSAVLYAAGWRYRLHAVHNARESRAGLIVSVLAASTLIVMALSAENENYWTLRGDVSADASFASSLALSFIWTLCASVFITVGFWRDFAPIRYLAMALFGLTVVKVFLVDLSALGGIYRILGFIGVGVVLLAVSFLYQRSRKKKPAAEEPGVA
jgi:uncharacterized membrane protein